MPSASRRAATALLLGAAAAAAEPIASSSGWDVIDLHAGVSITGRILADDGARVRIDAGFGEVWIDKERIDAIHRGDGQRVVLPEITPDATPSPSPAATADAGPWLLEARLSWGLHRGSLRSSGTVTDRGTGATQTLDIDQSYGQADPRPGGGLRLLRRLDSHPACAIGAQLATATAAGDGTTLATWSLEAVGAWSSQPRDGMRWNASVGAGWMRAAGDRSFAFADAAGTVLDGATIADRLAGPVLRLEAGPSWQRGPWRLGLDAGAAWSRLRGSADWVSDGGLYAGSSEQTAMLTALYAGLSVARTW